MPDNQYKRPGNLDIDPALELYYAVNPDTAAPYIDRALVRVLLAGTGRPDLALFTGFDNPQFAGGNLQSDIRLYIRNRMALLRLLMNPEYTFGELYTDGHLEIEGDLVELLCRIYRGRAAMGINNSPGRRLRSLFQGTGTGSERDNIRHHYDIGNDFYSKWLCDEMQYTCAYYPDDNLELEQAQRMKMHHICRKLRLAPGQTVVEAGCGWGGLARFMAREYGVHVRAYNISAEQLAYARLKLEQEGLQDRVEYIEDDYRNIRGRFDAFVSVGMLEHVGLDNHYAMGQVIDNCLAPNGIGLIHTIGFNRPDTLNPWIERHIFPGAEPPGPAQIMQILEPCDFTIQDMENLRLHYARTLQDWLARFEQHRDWITNRYDRAFYRAWRLYLSGSISAFLTGKMQLFQVLFTRVGNNAIPASRAYLYQDPIYIPVQNHELF